MYFLVPETAKSDDDQLNVRSLHLEFCMRTLSPETDKQIIALVVFNIMRRFGDDAEDLGVDADFVGVQSYLDDVAAPDEDDDGEVELEEILAADIDGDGIMDAREMHRRRTQAEESEIHSIGLGGFASPEQTAQMAGQQSQLGVSPYGAAQSAAQPGMSPLAVGSLPVVTNIPNGAAPEAHSLPPPLSTAASQMERPNTMMPVDEPSAPPVNLVNAPVEEIMADETLMAHLGLSGMELSKRSEPDDGTYML